MKEQLQYVDFDTAVLLKEVGFDWKVLKCYYANEPTIEISITGFRDHNSSPMRHSAPTLHLAAQWLREVKGLHIFANIFVGHIEWNYIINNILIARCENQMVSKDSYDSHDLALSAGITKALELLKNSK